MCTVSQTVDITLSRAVVGGGGGRARANGIVESVERRRARERSVAWGERERERDERTIDRSVESISIVNHRNRRSDRSRGEGWILGEG